MELAIPFDQERVIVANEERVALLKKSVKDWNKWRGKNPHVHVDFYGADLKGSNLSQADLVEVDLGGADLSGANLNYAILRGAYLSGANLNCADLRGVNLMGADLRRADLRGANLAGADLRGAVLSEADLKEALLVETDLHRANLVGTKFEGSRFGSIHLVDMDLSQAEGLEDVKHFGPSPISTSTLERSKGKIPEKFLRGCGLRDWEIESAKMYRDGLSEIELNDILSRLHDLRFYQEIQFYSVFISHSVKDWAFAQKLYDSLQSKGVRCWFAPEDMRGGKKVYEQIDAAVRGQERLLLLLSEHSMNSEWVKTEIAKARKKEVTEKRRVLFPIGLVPFEKIKEWECFDADVGKDSAREIREYFIPDFSQWEDEKVYWPAFKKLLEDLLAKE